MISNSAGFYQAEDIVLNGDFGDGYSPWETPGCGADGGGTFEVDEDNRFCVTVTTLGTDDE